MQWLVQGREDSVVMTAEHLIHTVLGSKEVRDDHRFVAHTLVEELQRVKTLGTMAPDELASLAVFIGYYYRVFLEQNEVEVQHVDSNGREDHTDQDLQ